jgi:hypothetical protein
MKCLLNNEKLTFIFRSSYVTCYNCDNNYYQTNVILSFAVMDLVFRIIMQQKRKFIILKKRKPIIHLLNYIDILNFNFNDIKFNITLSFINKYEIPLTYYLYLYRRFYDFYIDSLKVIECENSCIIRFEDNPTSKVQPRNSNLTAMLMYILEKNEIDRIDADGIIFYCVFLM